MSATLKFSFAIAKQREPKQYIAKMSARRMIWENVTNVGL